jgi:hypothetical protein
LESDTNLLGILEEDWQVKLSRWNKLGKGSNPMSSTICAPTRAAEKSGGAAEENLYKEEEDLLLAECITQANASGAVKAD